MKTYNHLRTLKSEHPELAQVVMSAIAPDYFDDEFMSTLGGYVFVVDSKEEYHRVLDENTYFDIAEEPTPEWLMLVCMNNNAGGPTWFVPTTFVTLEDRNKLTGV